MSAQDGPQPGDSILYRGSHNSRYPVWALVERVNGDGTLAISSGAFRRHLVIEAARVIRWQRGRARFDREFLGSKR